MKRICALILAVMLMACACAACAQEAETREGVILIEGIEETITETMYISPNGYSLWYPADMFAVRQEYGNDLIAPADAAVENVSLTIVCVDIPVDMADAFIEEATGGYMPGEAEISEVSVGKLESGLDLRTVQATLAEEIHRFYLVTGEERVFCVSAILPIEAAEGFGVRLDRIVSTMDVTASE